MVLISKYKHVAQHFAQSGPNVSEARPDFWLATNKMYTFSSRFWLATSNRKSFICKQYKRDKGAKQSKHCEIAHFSTFFFVKLRKIYTMSESKGTTVHLRFSVEATQGSRKSMEDYTSVTIGPQHDSECFFAVFDGHGGYQAASFARQNLWETIQKQKDFYSNDPDEVGKAIKRAFVETHTAMWKERGRLVYKQLNMYMKGLWKSISPRG